MDLQKKNSGDDAQSTTEEEFKDNLWHICHTFKQKTGEYPILCYDNVKIQRIADITLLQNEHGGDILLDKDKNKVKLPTYSPDCNRPIEHTFAIVKTMVRNKLYKYYHKYNTGRSLQTLVQECFDKLPKGAVAKDVNDLPLLWEVISTPTGIIFLDANDHAHVGSGGDWPKADYR